jgi:protein-disulfide isomerase
MTVMELPIEWIGFLLFSGISFAAIARVRSAVWMGAVFPMVISICGVAGAKAVDLGFRNWVVNLALAISAFVILRSSNERLPSFEDLRRMAKDLTSNRRPGLALLAVLGLAVALSIRIHSSIDGVTTGQANQANFIRWYSSQTAPSDDRLWRQGQVRVLAFTDYQCPFSASALPWAERLVRKLQDSSGAVIDWMVHDFPIDAACNPGYWGSLHPDACEAAAAVRFVGRHEGDASVEEFAAWLYERAGKFTQEGIREYLAARQLDRAFEVERQEMDQLVTADAVYGLRLGVTKTPSFFVNGVKLPSVAYLEHAISYELNRLW